MVETEIPAAALVSLHRLGAGRFGHRCLGLLRRAVLATVGIGKVQPVALRVRPVVCTEHDHYTTSKGEYLRKLPVLQCNSPTISYPPTVSQGMIWL